MYMQTALLIFVVVTTMVSCQNVLVPGVPFPVARLAGSQSVEFGLTTSEAERPLFVLQCSGDFDATFSQLSGNTTQVLDIDVDTVFRQNTEYILFTSPVDVEGDFVLTLNNTGTQDINCRTVYYIGTDSLVNVGPNNITIRGGEWLFLLLDDVNEGDMVTFIMQGNEGLLDVQVGYTIGFNRIPSLLSGFYEANLEINHEISMYELAMRNEAAGTLYVGLFEDAVFPSISDIALSAQIFTSPIRTLYSGESSGVKTLSASESHYYTYPTDTFTSLYLELIVDSEDLLGSARVLFSYEPPSMTNQLPLEWEDTTSQEDSATRSVVVTDVSDGDLYIRVLNTDLDQLSYTVRAHAISLFDINLDEDSMINFNAGSINVFKLDEHFPDVIHLRIVSDMDLNIFLSREYKVPSARHSGNFRIEETQRDGKFVKSVLISRDPSRRPLFFTIEARNANSGVGTYEITTNSANIFELDDLNFLGGSLEPNNFDFFTLDVFPDFPYIFYFNVESTFGSINALMNLGSLPTNMDHFSGPEFNYNSLQVNWAPVRMVSEGIASNLQTGTWNLRLSNDQLITNTSENPTVHYQFSSYLVPLEAIQATDSWNEITLSARKITFIQFTISADQLGNDMFLWVENAQDFDIYLNSGGYALQTNRVQDLEVTQVNNTAAIKFTPEFNNWYATIMAESFATNVRVSLRTENLTPITPGPDHPEGMILLPIWAVITAIASFVVIIIALIACLGPIAFCNRPRGDYQLFTND